MSVDVEKTAGIIDVLRKMSSKELAVTIFLVVVGILAAGWVENRYAKLKETEAKLHATEQRIKRHATLIMQVQTHMLEVINAQPPEVQRQIRERSAAFISQMRQIDNVDEGSMKD